MDRRVFLKTGLISLSVGATGCIGGQGEGISSPPSDANPRGLLPEAPDRWERTEVREMLGDMAGAEKGYLAEYTDPDGETYRVEVLRWPSDGKGSEQEAYSLEWDVYVINGNFGFAGRGADVDNVVTLLSNSSALNRNYVIENNLSESTENNLNESTENNTRN